MFIWHQSYERKRINKIVKERKYKNWKRSRGKNRLGREVGVRIG